MMSWAGLGGVLGEGIRGSPGALLGRLGRISWECTKMNQSRRKLTIWGGPAGVLGGPGGLYGPKAGPNRLQKISLGGSWKPFGGSWACPGGSRGSPGGVLGLLGAVLGRLGGVLGRLGRLQGGPGPLKREVICTAGRFLSGVGPGGEPYGGGKSIQLPRKKEDNPGQSKNQGPKHQEFWSLLSLMPHYPRGRRKSVQPRFGNGFGHEWPKPLMLQCIPWFWCCFWPPT